MRLLVRFALAVFLLCLLIIATYKLSDLRQHVISRNDPKKDADEVVRILLMSDDSASSWKTDVSVTVNVVIVLIVSLLSIALLITGIIVIALTVDSSVMDNESGDVDETTSYLRDDQTVNSNSIRNRIS
ncbi:unnamed protein product [Cercopithifilaria johnstoni]|uniref:Uncharacterized protein n=1 Tax=Cercopithifilaria johnstoni TaxID=2874296 RepID=A0A8J2LRC4_9BILA|nr:unnamed protein product [Cercopithifilaria johnstoni]